MQIGEAVLVPVGAEIESLADHRRAPVEFDTVVIVTGIKDRWVLFDSGVDHPEGTKRCQEVVELPFSFILTEAARYPGSLNEIAKKLSETFERNRLGIEVRILPKSQVTGLVNVPPDFPGHIHAKVGRIVCQAIIGG